MGRSSIVENVL